MDKVEGEEEKEEEEEEVDKAATSPACFEPCDWTHFPSTDNEAPTVHFEISSSSGLLMTIWTLLMVEPSLRAMKATFLLNLLFLIQPFTITALSKSVLFSNSIILILFMFEIDNVN